MKSLFALAAVAIILFLLVPNYLKLKNVNKTASILLKACGTLFALILAIIGHIKNPGYGSLLIIIAITLGMLGDILLEYKAPLGVIAFFLGNVFYILLLFLDSQQNISFLLILFSILFFLYTVFQPYMKSLGKAMFLLLPYAILVSSMAAASIPFLIQNTPHRLLFGFGTFLFAISDYLLAYRVVTNANSSFHQISLSVYYLAQLMIGLSVYLG